MISVIICSANRTVLQAALLSIKKTIGVPYEAIVIENSDGKKGISEVYNSGAAKAVFDILCFVHEDVIFETENWGRNVIKHLQDASVGIIGIAGGDTKSAVPSSWSSSVFQCEISIIQHFKFENTAPECIIKTGYPEDSNLLKPAVCLDGVWMCTRKDVFAEFKFDEENFKGFHGYDIDFSLQVFTKYKVGVVFDVLMHHFSEGKYDRTWLKSMMQVSKKWRHQLPLTVRRLTEEELSEQHWTCIHVFLDYLVELKYSLPVIIFYYLKYTGRRFFTLEKFRYYFNYILDSRKQQALHAPAAN